MTSPSSSTRSSSTARRASRDGVSTRRTSRISWRIVEMRSRTCCERPGADVVLELVDVVVEAVDHGEEPLGDLVDQQVEAHARGVSSRCAVGHEIGQVARPSGRAASCAPSRGGRASRRRRSRGGSRRRRRRSSGARARRTRSRRAPRAGAGLVVVAGGRAQPSVDRRGSWSRERGVDRGVVGIDEVDPPLGAGHGVTIWVHGARSRGPRTRRAVEP